MRLSGDTRAQIRRCLNVKKPQWHSGVRRRAPIRDAVDPLHVVKHPARKERPIATTDIQASISADNHQRDQHCSDDTSPQKRIHSRAPPISLRSVWSDAQSSIARPSAQHGRTWNAWGAAALPLMVSSPMHPPGSNVGLPPKRYLYDKADCPHDEARDDRAHPPPDSGSFLLESAPPLDLNARPETLLPNQEQPKAMRVSSLMTISATVVGNGTDPGPTTRVAVAPTSAG